MQYSTERKEAVLRKMVPPHNPPVCSSAVMIPKVVFDEGLYGYPDTHIKIYKFISTNAYLLMNSG